MKKIGVLFFVLFLPILSMASEADLVIPADMRHQTILYWGFLITVAGFLFGLAQFLKVKKIRSYKSMLDVANVIFETAKTYLIQQGKFLGILFVFIGLTVAFYFGWLTDVNFGFGGVLMILGWTVVGILGSYGVAWFGIRMNTLANSRMAFAALERKPIKLLNIPLGLLINFHEMKLIDGVVRMILPGANREP